MDIRSILPGNTRRDKRPFDGVGRVNHEHKVHVGVFGYNGRRTQLGNHPATCLEYDCFCQNGPISIDCVENTPDNDDP